LQKRLKAAKMELERKNSLLNLRKKLKSNMQVLSKYKSKISKYVPLAYDLYLQPSLVKHGIEMQIKLDVTLFCNASSNMILFNTKEFHTMDLKF
jgi:hypothetical protein